MTPRRTVEPQYQRQIELRDSDGLESLGLTTSQVWLDDPKRLLFILARYKFVAKMLVGRQRVLEVGCGDAFGSRIVLQEVASLHAVDIDALFVQDVTSRMNQRWSFECSVHDILQGPVPGGPYDGAYSLDVVEHMPEEKELIYVENLAASLSDDGVLIVGSPSIQSQAYASPQSKEGHVNCKDADGLRALMGSAFSNVLIFSMNDEVVHTGFAPMAHYLFAVCTGRRSAGAK